MLTLIDNISKQGRAYQQFVAYCQTVLKPKLIKDISRYAPNRRRLWLLNEPYLGTPAKIEHAYNDPYLSSVLQWLYPGCNTALISVHDCTSDARILHHRDAAFATAEARLLNLGNSARLSYSQDRRNNSPQNCTSYHLDCGDLIQFDCKHLHACTQAKPGRMGLVMWQLKSNYVNLL